MSIRVLVRIPAVASVVQNYEAVPMKGDVVYVHSARISGRGVVYHRELFPIEEGSISAVIIELDDWRELPED